MDYGKAIRIARALADVPQRELARRVSMDPSLVSMLENGKRRPSLQTLEKMAEALELPFHLFALLGTETKDATGLRTQDIEQLAIGLTKLLLKRDGDDSGRSGAPPNRKAQPLESKSTRPRPRNQHRKAR